VPIKFNHAQFSHKTYNEVGVSSISPGSPGPSPQDDDVVQVSQNGADPLEQLLSSIRESLGEVVEDVLDRAKGDHSTVLS